jgi:hypothetical protein
MDEHFVTLVVVAEDEETIAEPTPGVPDPPLHLVELEAEIAVGKRLSLRQAGLLVVGQDLDIHLGSDRSTGGLY